MKIHENKTLQRIVDTHTRCKSYSELNVEQCWCLLAIASIDRPYKQEIWQKTRVCAQFGNKNLRYLLLHGYITEDGTKEASIKKVVPVYALTSFGEFTVAKLLGLK